jgi:two-component system, NarL family, response regulator DevR
MFVRYYLELPLPADRVEQALLGSPSEWLAALAACAQRGDGLLGEVGVGPRGRRLTHRVAITLGSPMRFPSMTSPPLGAPGRAGRPGAVASRGRGDGAGLPGPGGQRDRHRLGGSRLRTTAALSSLMDVGRMVAMDAPLRVMLVDDHVVVRDGIKSLLEATDDLVVCAEAGSVREAVAVADRTLPDVIVMDVRLQDGSGIQATRDIRAARPATQVLMLTSFADDEALFASIMAGAAGYVLKQIRGEELLQAIRTVGRGQSLLDPAVTARVLDRLRKGKHLLMDERLSRLSPQEERILELVADGNTNGQIGQELGLAEKTVKNYVSSILTKLEVARRAEAAAYLARHTTTPGT